MAKSRRMGKFLAGVALVILCVLWILSALCLLETVGILRIKKWIPQEYIYYYRLNYLFVLSPILLLLGVFIWLLIDQYAMQKKLKQLKNDKREMQHLLEANKAELGKATAFIASQPESDDQLSEDDELVDRL